MTTSQLSTYIKSVLSENSTTPAIMDEDSIFILISWVTGQHIMSYEDLIEANISTIFVYDIPEDKKEFNIETVRKFLSNTDLMPYSGKHIYILRNFSTATLWAQNSLLKILEDCPPYAVILLEVINPNSIIETIQSRVINLTAIKRSSLPPQFCQEIINDYKDRNYQNLAKNLYNLKCSSDEAILILRWVYPYLDKIDASRCDLAIESLSSTHENPRSILDTFFL